MGKRRSHNEIEGQEGYDEIDKYIEKTVTQKIEVPESFEKAMREALYSERFYKRLRKRKMIRAISTACATVILTSGVAVGGFIAYEKIWKEPKQYTYEEFKNTIANSDVPDEDKESLISEEEAKKNALEIVNNLGYVGEEIEGIELNKNNQEDLEEIFYLLETNNKENQLLKIKIDAETGNLITLEDANALQKSIEAQQITEEQAKNISMEICNDIKYEKDDVEINSCEEGVLKEGNEISLWDITYMKKYNGVVNPYEKLVIRFWVEDNVTKISSIYTENTGKYENNPTVITEEEAIEIAKNKEKSLTRNEISSVSIKYGIQMMNKYIYELETNRGNVNSMQTDGDVINSTSKLVRNVWEVNIKHNRVSESNDLIQRLKDASKIYYVDVTTGEIIGGKDGYIY